MRPDGGPAAPGALPPAPPRVPRVYVALLLVTVLLPGTGACTSGGGEPTPGRAARARRAASPVVVVVPATDLRLDRIPAVVRAGDTFDVAVSARTPGPAEDLEVAFAVGPPLATRSAFREAVRGRVPRQVLQLYTVPVAPGPAPGSYTAAVSPAVASSGRSTAERLVLRSAGVYPVKIMLRRGGEAAPLASLVTFAVSVPAHVSVPLRFAWVWPLYDPPPRTAGGADTALQRALTDDGRLRDIASAQVDSPLTLLPVPDTLRRAADAGPGGEEFLAALRRRVGSGATVAAAGPYALMTADAAAAAPDLAAREAAAGTAAAGDLLGRTPDASVAVAWGASVPPDAIRRLQTGGARGVLMEATALNRALSQRGPAAATLTQPFEVSGVPGVLGLRADPDLAAALKATGGPVAAAQQLLADVTVLHLDAPSTTRGAVLLPDPRWEPGRPLLEEVDQRLRSAPHVRPVTLPQFLAEVPPAQGRKRSPLVLTPESSPPGPAAAPQYALAVAAQERLADLTAVVAPPDQDRLERLTVTLLESLDAALVRGRRAGGYARSVARAADRALRGVALPRGATITLTSERGVVPVSLRNESGYTLRLRLTLSSDALVFDTGNSRDVTVPPRSFTTDIPVRTSTSGAFRAELLVTSPDGRVRVARTSLTIRSTATNRVTVVLTVGALAFLGLWWIMAARRRRVIGKHARRLHHPARNRPPRSSPDLPTDPGAPMSPPVAVGGPGPGAEGGP